MKRKKISLIILAAVATNIVSGPVSAYAVEKNTSVLSSNFENGIIQDEVLSTEASITKFDLYGKDILESYNKVFKVQKSEISSISNNGGKYASSTLDKAFDDNMATYFETGKPNSSNFTNEIVVTFEKEQTLDRVVYAARQDGAKGKGFAKSVEIYGSTIENEDEFTLVAEGTYTGSTGDVVEVKFNAAEFKKLKFVFKEANAQWASASELWFYKADSIIDSMNELFTDTSKYKLNEKYKNIDALNELAEKLENHPMKDLYSEDINLAKEILQDGEFLQNTESTIKVSSIAQSEYLSEYNEKFQISTSEFKSVTNNGGHYGQSVLSKLYDGDNSTHWETGKTNSDTFKNEVEFTFDSIKEIEKIIMTPRQDASNKGFPLKYEIYGSLNENSTDYELITSGSIITAMASTSEIVFPKTKFKKLKFKFIEAYNGMASLGEMSFYTEDTVTAKVESIFTDNLHTTLNESYDSIEEVTELENLISDHPLKKDYIKIINKAKDIINGIDVIESEIITLSQRGNENTQRAERRQIFAGGNLDVTGYYVMPGESFEVYLDADSNSILPQLVFSQVGEVDGAGNHKRSLSPGRNVLKAPSGTKGFAIYFTNKALPEQQSYIPKIKLFGNNLKSYPVYIHGKTNPNEYIETVKNHTGANMTDVVGERYLLSVRNSEAVIAYVDRGYSPDKTNADMEKMISTFDRLAGYDINDENPIHRPSKALYHYKATNSKGLYASNEYIHYSAESGRSMLSGSVTGWGFVHEFAHQIENQDMRLIEVTNNIYSTYVQREFGTIYRDFTGIQKNVDKYFTYNEGSKGFGGFGTTYDYTFGLFERLLVLNQIIDYFGEDVYSTANRLMRENLKRYNSTGSYQSLITSLSEASGYDLAPHFEYYNYPVTEKTKEFTSQFKTLDKKIRYITMYDYQKALNGVETFKEDTKAVITHIKRESDGFTLTLNTTNNNDAMTAYEIYRDGEFVGFSRSNTYKDTVDSTNEYTYEVIAYDYRVNESIKSDALSTTISYKPELRGNSTVIIAKGEEFNPLNYISAYTYSGKEISIENVKVTSTVDTNIVGNYEVKYEVEDMEQKVTKTINVDVVSKYDYLSDTQWTSVETVWGTPRRNSNIKGRVNGEIQTFEKGFGIHANGQIVYNLGDHNYEKFETLVGVDATIAAQNNSSIKFKIIADGNVLASTDVIKYYDDMVYINVPVKGVKELRIEVTDAGNGNTLDHAIIANPKLATNNAIPSLEVEKEVAIKLGETFDNLIGDFSASDIEDGDLTSKVKVTGVENVDLTKPGKYEIKYSVTDSDNNTVEKSRTISVVNMKEFTYLSDIDYKSASQSWSKLAINKAVSGNALRLTNDQNESVTYEKGLGTHSASTIIYDLTGSDYKFFTSYIGVDRAMYNSVGSVSFEVYVDGVMKYESGLMKAKDAQKFIEVNIAGASELKLVVKDGGNGNGSDHANWADARIYSSESKIDLEELNSVLAEIEDLNPNKYTEESWNNFIALKDKAIESLNNGYTEEDVNNVIHIIREAQKELVIYVSPERLELQALSDYAESITIEMVAATNHIESRWYNFTYFKNMAAEYLIDETKTNKEISYVIYHLNYFISELCLNI